MHELDGRCLEAAAAVEAPRPLAALVGHHLDDVRAAAPRLLEHRLDEPLPDPPAAPIRVDHELVDRPDRREVMELPPERRSESGELDHQAWRTCH